MVRLTGFIDQPIIRFGKELELTSSLGGRGGKGMLIRCEK
jgi:hypothetical protein